MTGEIRTWGRGKMTTTYTRMYFTTSLCTIDIPVVMIKRMISELFNRISLYTCVSYIFLFHLLYTYICKHMICCASYIYTFRV